MKRDINLVRNLLLLAEQDGENHTDELGDIETIWYHAMIMVDGGLLYSMEKREGGEFVFYLTWHGHECLNAIRDERNWTDLMERLKWKELSLPFESIVKIMRSMQCGTKLTNQEQAQ